MPSTIRKSRSAPFPRTASAAWYSGLSCASDCLGEALKLNHNGPLFDAVLICLFGDTASEEAPARSEDSTLAVHLGRILFVRTKDVANIGSYSENAECFMCSQSFTNPRDILPQDVPLRLLKCFVSEY